MRTVEMFGSINRRRFFAAAAGALTATQLGMSASARAQAARATLSRLPVQGDMPPLAGATAWINASPLTPADLRGKAVLVEFWTYTCINWLRSHPYVRAWDEKYKDNGLVVLGVHTPEFPFEGDIENVRRAVRDMRINYPVAVDSDYGIGRAFRNHYWPAFDFVDAQGRIRHHQFGEGGYEQSEQVIQQLLAEAGSSGVGEGLVAVEGRGLEAAADWANLRSPESYVNYESAANFSSSGGAVLGKSRTYVVPARLALNQWALAGDWTIEKGLVALNRPDGRIACRFHARDVHLVMGAADQTRPARFRVSIYGAPAGSDHGGDVDADGMGGVKEPRLYQLVRQSGAIADRTFEIAFLDPGVRAYCFTFG